MTAPRQVLQGKTYFVTRRCLQQEFLLTPRKLVNQVFAYQLALAAARTGVQLHAYCVMSNHHHLVVTDPGARLPEFQQQLHSIVGRALNLLHDRKETFWKPGSYSAIPLETREDVIDKTVYTLANPVAARLVKRGRMWPGLWSAPSTFGTSWNVARPSHFYAEEGEQPVSAPLRLEIPPGFESAREFSEAIEIGLAAREAEIQAEGGGFLGKVRVLKQRGLTRTRGQPERRPLNPKVAAKDRGLRMELIRRLKAFLAEYRDALLDWREGKIEPIFPAGTYLMRVAHGVAVAGAG